MDKGILRLTEDMKLNQEHLAGIGDPDTKEEIIRVYKEWYKSYVPLQADGKLDKAELDRKLRSSLNEGKKIPGPYKVLRIAPGDRIELEAFKGYWGKKPLYSKVIFKSITDAQSRIMELMAGEIDAVADVGAILPEQAAEIRNHPDLVLKQVQVATTHLLVFNCRKPPFSELENRLWLAGTLNRSQLISAFAKGAGTEARDPYTPLSQDFAFGLIQPQPRAFPGFSLQSEVGAGGFRPGLLAGTDADAGIFA